MRNLTARHCQIVKLIAQGKPNREIAAELGLSEGTVKTYLCAIMKRLRLRNRVEVALWSRDSATKGIV